MSDRDRFVEHWRDEAVDVWFRCHVRDMCEVWRDGVSTGQDKAMDWAVWRVLSWGLPLDLSGEDLRVLIGFGGEDTGSQGLCDGFADWTAMQAGEVFDLVGEWGHEGVMRWDKAEALYRGLWVGPDSGERWLLAVEAELAKDELREGRVMVVELGRGSVPFDVVVDGIYAAQEVRSEAHEAAGGAS